MTLFELARRVAHRRRFSKRASSVSNFVLFADSDGVYFQGTARAAGSMDGCRVPTSHEICGGMPMMRLLRSLVCLGSVLAVAFGGSGAFAIVPGEVVNQTWCSAAKTCMQWSAAAAATRDL